MHTHNEKQQSPYTPAQIFDLVIDIERYPEFLPWCRAARILERGEGRMLAELVISFKHITESYVSDVVFSRPSAAGEEGWIIVSLIRGPFEHLSNQWRFHPRPDGGTDISLSLSFQFRSRLLDSLIGLLFGKASAKMASAFSKRADQLYGGKG